MWRTPTMHCTMTGILALVLGLFAPGTQDKTATSAEEYQALLKEYEAASQGFRKAETDVERRTAVEGMDKFPRRFVELGEKNSKEAIALEALTQAVRVLNAVDSLTQTAWEMSKTAFPAESKDNSAAKALRYCCATTSEARSSVWSARECVTASVRSTKHFCA